MRSYALAMHAYPDESVWNTTVKYLDDVHYINGQWKFAHSNGLSGNQKSLGWQGQRDA